MSKRQAMIQAGYSISTANQAKRVIQTNSMRSLSENLIDRLENAGLTVEHMAKKLIEWFYAKKSNGEPDCVIQIKAFDRLLAIIKDVEKIKETKPTRRISIEEWVNQDN